MTDSALAPGRILAGKYRIERILGRGGFSVVYLATQLALDRPVALKMLLPRALTEPVNLTLFEHEARFARQLKHPHIIDLYDFGHSQEGLPFIVMELLPGQALQGALKPGPLSVDRVMAVGRQILIGLQAAHEEQVIHRDIKPSNIFLCRYAGHDEFVKLIDFGIARAFQEPGTLVPGKVLGTPLYMAPEQIRAHGVCPATDLYALGLVLAECLSGHTVFPSDGRPLAILEQQLSDEPVPLPDEVLESPLGGLIWRATRKDSHARYSSAAEMLAAMERVRTSPGRDLHQAPTTSQINVHPEIGARLDNRFRLDEVLGERLLSTVFRGTQLSLNRPVFIKILQPESRQQGAGIFRDEVAVISQLHSPHTIQIIERGETPDGLPWLVMEWLEGIALRELMQTQGPQPLWLVRDVALQILESLSEAHGHGLIHGNLKPSNLFLCQTQAEGHLVKVTDFTFSRRYVGSGGDAVETGGGQIVGSVRYMAPELLLDRAQGPWTDFYALGLLLIEMVQGQPVFDWSLSSIEVARGQVSRTPIELPRQLQRHPLGAVLAKCVEKSPRRRFTRASQVRAALEAFAT
jgi:serine/threonine protein kinase